MKVVVLGAGCGERLGGSVPKPLVKLSTKTTILDQQLACLTHVADFDDIIIVVGFKKKLIMEEYPYLRFACNDNYATTNTAASLLVGLQEVTRGDVMWLNGDVVFDATILDSLRNGARSNLVWVNRNSVGDEEVKYTVDGSGYITEISKSVKNAFGEAVGINLVTGNDLAVLKVCLEACSSHDYFERGLEFAIERGVKFLPIDIGARFCVEVDFEEDLERERAFVQKRGL